MKNYIYLLIFFLVSFSFVSAQNNTKIPILDKSPMDISYYPANFPILKIQDKIIEPLTARIIYSRPQKADRIVFGNMVPYNSIWRFGANESTEIEFYKDVKIDGKKINKGRYTLYAIPDPEKWTFILNTDNDSWGSFKYDSSKDVLRIESIVQKNTEIVENLSIHFEKTSTGLMLIFNWDDIRTSLPINIQ